MFISANKVIGYIKPYVLPVLVGVVCVAVGIVLSLAAIKQIKRQVKLYNSITLVELKNFKWHYLVFIGVLAFFIFYNITQMADSQGPEAVLMRNTLAMKRWHTNIMLGAVLWLLVSAEFFLVVLMRSKSAVVDRGVYSGMRYLDWYHVHDYIIDEERGHVILSSDKYTFFTLRGTTPPLKVAKNDIPKLKFILNKNKNKFSI